MHAFHYFSSKTLIGLWSMLLLCFSLSGSMQAQGCSQPSNLNTVNLSTTSVRLSWSAIQSSTNYTVQYRVGTVGAWTTVSAGVAKNLTINGLIPSAVYTWRVKASCSTYSSIATFNTGGSGGNPNCSQPSNLNATSISTTSANLSWSAIQGAFNYTIQYRVSATVTWITTSATTATSLTLSGLSSGTEYSWRVKASCSDYSSIAVFTTTNTSGGGGGGSTSCSAPSNTNTDVVLPTSAHVSWEPQGGALNYTVQYRLATRTTYTTVGTLTGSSIAITGLQPGVEYVWRVKANCSPYGSDVQFTTPLTALRTTQITNEPATAAVSIFPNPANDQVQIRAALAGTQVVILDAMGRTLATDIIRDNIYPLNVSQLENGIYFVRLSYDNQLVQTERLLIAR